jgi:ligand-binding SRPBCC domain-containing protein
MEKPFYFRDDMIKGAFKTMTHEHLFAEAGPNKTTKRDIFCFSAPFGIFGSIAERLFLRSYMTRFLKAKNRELKRLIESPGS